MTATRTISLIGTYLCFALSGGLLIGGLGDFAPAWIFAGGFAGAAFADALTSAV